MTKEKLIESVLKNAKLESKKQAQQAVESVFGAITKSLSPFRDSILPKTAFGNTPIGRHFNFCPSSPSINLGSFILLLKSKINI